MSLSDPIINGKKRRSSGIQTLSPVFLTLSMIGCYGLPSSWAQATSGTTSGAQPPTLPSVANGDSIPLRGASVDRSNISTDSLLPAGHLSALVGREIEIAVSRGASPSKKMKALHIVIQNKSESALVFDGGLSTLQSQSEVNSGEGATRALSQADLDGLKRPPTTFKGKFVSDTKATVTAAATVGAVQTAEGILNEHGPILKRYEWDESRRENEESRFGKRLLYPGDRSEGQIYFPSATTFEGMVLKMPVKSFYDGAEQTAVTKVLNFGGGGEKSN